MSLLSSHYASSSHCARLRMKGDTHMNTMITRRYLLRFAGLFGVGSALPASPLAAAQKKAAVASRSRRAEHLRIDRRAAAHQLSRHADDHRRIRRTAGGARREDRGQSAVRAARRSHGRRRQAPGRADWSRVGNGQRRMRGGDLSRDGRLRGRRQPRSARADSQSRRVSQRRGHHPDELTQRLRRRDPCRWREGPRSGHAGGTDARHRSEDGDDLPLRRPAYRLRSDVDRGHLRDRETARRARDGRRGCRNPHDSQRSPAARGDARRIQRRQVHPRSAERRPAPRAEGSREGGMDPQRAAPRLLARDEGRPRGDDRDAGRGRELGEARSPGRVGRVGRALRLHRRKGVRRSPVSPRRCSASPVPA